jgi:hypothetical protein
MITFLSNTTSNSIGSFLNFKALYFPLTLLEIMSYATTMFATGMQLPIACNYAGFFNATAMDFGPFFGCVCNYGATMITFIPTFG